jgi:thiamine biosynthesis protein ThiS
MKLIVNGAARQVANVVTVADLLADSNVNLKLDTVRVAVELNGKVVPRRDFAAVRLNEGDTLEIVTLVGGG